MRSRILVATVFFMMITALGHSQDARTVAERSTKAIEFESMEMISTLSIYDGKGSVRTREVAVATKKFDDATKTLMRFLSPAEVQGTSVLIYDYENKADDMWIYLPSLRKSRRVVSTDKGKSFMGSEFSNADMSKPNLDDFTYTIIGNAKVDDFDCFVVEAKTVNKQIEQTIGFAKRVSYIDKSSFLAHKFEVFDSNGRKLKEMQIYDYRKQSNGKYFAFSMDVVNSTNNRRSEMRVSKFQLGTSLKEIDFSVASMEK